MVLDKQFHKINFTSMIFSSPTMIMQISIPKLLIEIASASKIQCLEAGEKTHRERERERERDLKNKDWQ